MNNIEDIFYIPPIDRYNFIRIFFAQLTLNSLYIIKRKKLYESFYNVYKNKKYENITADIYFQVTTDFISSDSLSSSISEMITFGLISYLTPSPIDDIILINRIDTDYAQKILEDNKYDNAIIKDIADFTKDFLKDYRGISI